MPISIDTDTKQRNKASKLPKQQQQQQPEIKVTFERATVIVSIVCKVVCPLYLR
jgi:hypothetical protein